ncbi:MAG: class I SAM-dependent rRNA methyltransferase [Deltaproteobacteria bacterium]|nr:class I SAM-dependent rRNA methyltransferase [Deltaproteobacteria bacterium]
MFASVIISASAAKKLESGYPWIFERDIFSRRFDMAGIVAMQDKRGRFMGQAFYSPKSKIALRFITKSKAALDKEFWRRRILASFDHRTVREVSDAFRVIYAESDGIPSVVIDKYNDIFAIQTTSAGAETIKSELIDIIAEECRPAAIIEKNNVEVRKLEGLQMIERIVYGDKTTTIVHEGSQKFEADILHGQKTGAYLDYRAFRLKARELVRNSASLRAPQGRGNLLNAIEDGKLFCCTRNDMRALDLFCYQGWLSCHIAGKADKVIAVDASKEAIKAAKRNTELNEHANIEFICKDVFDFLSCCNEKFDFIHVDPPPFAKGRVDLPSAIKGYGKLIKASIKLLKSGGILFASSCSHHISENLLEKMVCGAAAEADAKCDIIYRGIQDKDHPVLKGFPESLYLKAIAVKVD